MYFVILAGARGYGLEINGFGFRGFIVFLLLAYTVSSFLAFYSALDVYRVASVLIGMMFFLVFSISARLSYLRVALFVGLVCLGFLFSSFSHAVEKSIFSIFLLIAVLSVTWAAFRYGCMFWAYELPFYAFLALTGGLIIFGGYDSNSFNFFLSGGSRNVYSGILLALSCGYVVSRLVRLKTISLFLLGGVFVCSVYLYSRNGIICSFILFLTVAWLRGRFYRFVVVLSFFVGGVFLSSVYEYFISSTGFSFGLDSPRFAMLLDYVSAMDLYSFIFGGDLFSIPSIAFFEGNPHNAFIRIHSFYGVLLFLFICLWLFSLYLILMDKKYILAVVFILCVYRSFFDIFYLFNLFDYGFLPVLFYCLFRRYFNSPSTATSALYSAL